jgi:hypothetical protein
VGGLTDQLRAFPRRPQGGRSRHRRRGREAPPVGRLLRARRESAADLDAVEAAQGSRRGPDGLGLALRSRGGAALSVGDLLGPAEILTKDIGQQTARIMHRIAGTEEPPEPQSDEALAAVDRVILALTVERVSAVTHM